MNFVLFRCILYSVHGTKSDHIILDRSTDREIALLRDTVPLPIVYTVRSVGQIGKFPAEPERIFALLREGLRAGIEWMDVEACWPLDQVPLIVIVVSIRIYIL